MTAAAPSGVVTFLFTDVRGFDPSVGGERGLDAAALAAHDEVWCKVSSTLRDLVIGSGLEFEERGKQEPPAILGCCREGRPEPTAVASLVRRGHDYVKRPTRTTVRTRRTCPGTQCRTR